MRKPNKPKPARGRPLKGNEPLMRPIAVRFPPTMRAAIEEIRSSRMDEPELSQVIRELVAEALEARGKIRR